MCQKLLTAIFASLLVSGLAVTSVQAHTGSSEHHYVVDSSGNPVKSSSGCVTSSGSGGVASEACGDGAMMAKVEPAPAPEPAPDARSCRAQGR